jgi:GNAT superfamily N-acetyltransferase
MHIEHSCRTAMPFLPLDLRDPGQIRPRPWRAWLTCAPPYDRHPTTRTAFIAYEFSDTFGFVAIMHDSIFAGYRADIAGLFVIPMHRREGIGTMLLLAAARWLDQDGIWRVTADCYANDPTRTFFDRMGGVVIASTSDDSDPAAKITYGFANFRELAMRGT